MAPFGLETLLRPRAGESESDDEHDDIIDVVAVHGLNGADKNIWVSKNDDTQEFIQALFGDRASRVRLSVYRYDPTFSPVSAFILDKIRQEGSLLLAAVTELGRAYAKRPPIIFLAHDFGCTIIKQALIISTYHHTNLRDVLLSTRSIVTFGCPHKQGADQETQDAFAALLKQGKQTKPVPRNLDLADALAQAVTEVNYIFAETKARNCAKILAIWSTIEEPSDKIFVSDLYQAHAAFSCHAAHPNLMQHTDAQKWVKWNLQSLPLATTLLQPRSELLQAAYHDVSGHKLMLKSRTHRHLSNIEPQLGVITDDPTFEVWQSGFRRLAAYVIVPDEHRSAPVASAIYNELWSRYQFRTLPSDFRHWDRRSNRVETFLFQFLLFGRHVEEQDRDPISGPTRFLTLDTIFLRVYAALLFLSSKGEMVTWIFANPDQEDESYQWLMRKVKTLLADSDIRLQVMIISPDSPPAAPGFPDLFIFHAPKVEDDIVAARDKSRSDNSTGNGTESVETARNLTGAQQPTPPQPELLTNETMELLANHPRLHSMSLPLDRLLISCAEDLPLRKLIFTWFNSMGNHVSISELERTVASLSPLSPSLVFQQILDHSITDSKQWEQAKWALELVLYTVRPLSVFEVEDLDNLLTDSTAALQTPLLQISRYGVSVPSLCGLVTVLDQEVRFGHAKLREFLLARQDNSHFAFGGSSRAARSHARIAVVCLEYLASAEGRGQLADHADKSTVSESSVLFESSTDFRWYAVKYWAEHAKLAGGEILEQKEYIDQLVQRSTLDVWAIEYWRLSLPCTRPSAHKISSIATLAEHGLGSIIDSVLTSLPDQPDDEKIVHALEQAAKVGAVEVVHRLRLLRGLHAPVPLAVVTASLSSKNETLILELVELISREDESDTEISSTFTMAALLGLVAVMKALIPYLPTNVEWNEAIPSACFSGNCEAFELVYYAILAQRRSAAPDVFDVRKKCQLLMEGFITACRYGHGGIVAFLAARKCTLPLAEGEKADTSHQASWVQTVMAALEATTSAGQANVLGILLASSDDLSDTYVETLKQCLETAIAGAMFGCSTRLFECLASHVSAEELQNTARSHLKASATKCHVPLFKLVLGFAGGHLESESLSEVWTAGTKAIYQSIQLLELLLDHYSSVWSEDERHRRMGVALCSAGEVWFNDLAFFLLERGADPNYSDLDSGVAYSPLVIAATRGNEALTDRLIKGGANLEARTQFQDYSLTPLSLTFQRPRIMRTLIKAGADLNMKYDTGESIGATALHASLASRDAEVYESTRVLLENNCEINVYVEKQTELTRAVSRGRIDIVQLLLDAGANPTLQPSRSLSTPLLHTCVAISRPDIMRILLLYNIPIEDPDEEGDSALHWITDKSTPEVVKLLVNRGALVNMTGDGDLIPLSRAISVGNLQVVKYLISVKADTSFQGKQGLTQLHRVCSLDNTAAPEILKLLLENGADINCPDASGTPFQSTIDRVDPDSPVTAAIVRQLLDSDGFNVDAEGPWWGPNINVACLAMGLDIVEELISRGAKVDLKDRSGREAIHFAAYRTTPYLECLVKAGANLDANDSTHRTLLHIGVLSGRLDVVQYIIRERKEFVNVCDMNGWTPLLWAVCVCDEWGVESSERAAIVEELLRHGADRLVHGLGHDRTWTALKLAGYHGLSDDILQLVTPSEEELGTLDHHQQGRWRYAISEKGRTAQQHLGYCDFCLKALFGLYHLCESCDGYCLCFKCYRSQQFIHPGHDFHQGDEEEYAIESRDVEEGDEAGGAHARDSSLESASNDGDRKISRDDEGTDEDEEGDEEAEETDDGSELSEESI